MPILRSLYGLKQAGQVWNETLDKELTDIGWIHASADSCLYVLKQGKLMMFLTVYVDGFLLLVSQVAYHSLYLSFSWIPEQGHLKTSLYISQTFQNIPSSHDLIMTDSRGLVPI